VRPLGILKFRMFNHMCCLALNSTCLRVLLALFFISFLACSKSLLGWVYNSSCPLTISIASLEWSFCPMGMVKSTNGFLVSFPTLIQMETSSLSNVLWSCNKTPSRVCLNIFDRHAHSSWGIGSTPHWPSLFGHQFVNEMSC